MNAPGPEGDAIAIVGLAGRFPGAPDVRAFWANLRAGVESITRFSPGEAEFAPLDGPAREDRSALVGARGLIADADCFDAAFFGFTPREAELTDPQHRVLLECAWSALEDAGYRPDALPGLAGVFAGAGLNSYLLAHVLARPDVLRQAGAFQAMIANDKDFLPLRIAYKLDLRGPCLGVQTGCSTSLVAVCLACQHLLGYQCDLALAGGVSIGFPPKRGLLHQEGGIISRDGNCRAFDAGAAGTVPGDGAGLVVLKRLADAVADRDTIRAVIRGFAVNNDGAGKVGFTAPGVDGQAAVIALALAHAGVPAESISYVEAHGTGTPLGDPIEFAGLARAFGERNGSERCALGSVKTNIGHLDAAAGIAGLIKTILALGHRELPPSLHFRTPNPRIDFARSSFAVNDRLRVWAAPPGTPRRAGVSSFGIGGTNAHVVLEEAPAGDGIGVTARPARLLLLSARSPAALARARLGLAAHLRAHPDLDLDDAAYTLQVGRKAFAHRLAVVGRDPIGAAGALESGPAAVAGVVAEAGEPPPVCFLFSGTGSLPAGVTRGLYESVPRFREEMEAWARRFEPHLAGDLRSALYPPRSSGAADDAPPGGAVTSQAAWFAIACALARVWIEWGVRPATVLGHSLGECAAAWVAGALSDEDAAALVAARARVLEAQPAGGMLAVRAAPAAIAALLPDGVAVAAENAPDECVVAGPVDALTMLRRRLAAKRIGARRLTLDRSLHSPAMEPLVAPLAGQIRSLALRPPTIPWISSRTARPVSAEEATDPTWWAGLLREPVRFADAIGAIATPRPPVLLEVGPGRVLAALARRAPGRRARVVAASLESSLTPADEFAALLRTTGRLWAHGVEVDWVECNAGRPGRRVPLPTYPFERERHVLAPPSPLDAGAPGPAPARASVATPIPDRLRAIFAELAGVDPAAVNPAETFSEQGLDSLFLSLLSLSIKDHFGMDLPLREFQGTEATLDRLAGSIATRLPTTATTATPAPPVAPAADPAAAPLTEAQREIWFATQLGPAVSAAYNEACTVILDGPLDGTALEDALRRLVARHDALRVTIDADGGTQRFAPADQVAAFLDHAAAAPAEPLAAAVATFAAAPFDLGRGPLWRARLVRVAAERHAFVLVVHHLVCDGMSLEQLVVDLAALYTAARANRSPDLPPAPCFARFAQDCAARAGSDEATRATDYWLAQFADGVPVLELPTDRPRPARRSHEAGHAGRPLSRETGGVVRALRAAHGSTPFTVLLAAFNAVLHRLSGQDDLVVGIPAAAQVLGGREHLVGHAVNLLPFRSRLADGASFGTFLSATQAAALDAYEHWQLPFAGLLRHLNVPRPPNRVPLASVTFNFGRRRTDLRFGEASAELAATPKRFVNFDLNFSVVESAGGWLLDCHYSRELFDEATINSLFDRYEILLRAAGADPARPVHRLPLLTDGERRRVLAEWNQTFADRPRHVRLHELVGEQARRTPESIAVVDGDRRVTYRELDAAANRLARRLRRLGLEPGACAGLAVDRTATLVTAVLGVLKAGGVYVPLDPAYPRDRLEYMLRDADVRLLVADAGFPDDAAEPRLLRCDPADPGLEREDPAAPDVPGGPADLAYVIYTSGSTGRPKGVAIEHGSAVALVHWARSLYSPGELAGVLAATSLCFDLSVFELFAPLCTGGTVILARDLLALPQLPARNEVTLVNTVPSALAELLRLGALPPSVHTVNLAGEPLPADLVQALYAAPTIHKVYDLYGPTEDTTYSTCALRLPDGPVTIGRPIANTQLYLLDRHLEPVPPGVPGEICLAGDGLARGYLNQPGLTREKFVSNPFSEDPRSRLYRTGDLARHRPDGSLEFLGRLDQQVKVRGFRIEPAEVESVLRADPAVAECAVIVRDDPPAGRRLVAYVVPARAGDQLDVAELRAGLSRQLPDYMLPAVLVPLPRLPRTPNGKLDRRSLPAPAEAPRAPGLRRGRPPRTDAERTLAEIWRAVLGVSTIGVDDDFFQLGGHSLLVTQVIARVRDAFHVELSLRAAFDAPSLGGMARLIERAVVTEIEQAAEADPCAAAAAVDR